MNWISSKRKRFLEFLAWKQLKHLPSVWTLLELIGLRLISLSSNPSADYSIFILYFQNHMQKEHSEHWFLHANDCFDFENRCWCLHYFNGINVCEGNVHVYNLKTPEGFIRSVAYYYYYYFFSSLFYFRSLKAFLGSVA